MTDFGHDHELLTLEEVAAYLRVDKAKLVQMSRCGKFPGILEITTREKRVRRAEFEEWESGPLELECDRA